MKHFRFENVAVRLAGTPAAVDFLTPIFAERRSELLVVALCSHDASLIELLTYRELGTAKRFPMEEVLRKAVSVSSAGVIVAHNHHAAEQSSADEIQVSRSLASNLDANGMTLLDYLVFGRGPWRSFRRSGLI